MRRPTISDATPTAAAAFRKDLSRHGDLGVPEVEQGLWIMIAALLQHAVREQDMGVRKTIVRQAAAAASELIGTDEVARLIARDAPLADASNELNLVGLAVRRMDEAGATVLGRATIEAMRAVTEHSTLDKGRLLAYRARLAWQSGALDEALDTYEMVEEIGTTNGIPELVVRAWTGYATLAQIRGNYPRVRECSTRVVALAEVAGLRRLAANGHHGLMIVEGMAGNVDAALAHGWEQLLAADGDPAAEAAVLNNVGQLLLERGDHKTAAVAFSRALALRPPVRIIVAAAGGLAVSSALIRDIGRVNWVVSNIEPQAESCSHRAQMASTLLDCATALFLIGDAERADHHCRLALASATKYGFHEIELRAEALGDRLAAMTVRRTPSLPSTAASLIRQRMDLLGEVILPDHILETISM